MSIDHLTLDILYQVESNNFEVGGDVNDQGRKGLVENFLLGQVGAGADDREPNVQDTYRIQLQWYPHDDRIVSRSDTGNKGLRDGILMQYLSYLNE